MHYQNPDVDRLIEEASAATDEQHRGASYTRAQQLIAEDVPYISLWYRTNVAIFQPDIHGVSLSPIADLRSCGTSIAMPLPLRSTDAAPFLRCAADDAPSGSAPVCPSATRSFLAVLAVALAVPAVARAQTPASRIDAALGTLRYDPALRFRTIATARFDIYFHQREEALARRLAGFIEEAAAEIDGRLGAPRGRVHVILVDQTDQSNGWATVFPYNTIELAAVPPPSQSTIGNASDWLRLVFSHEYTHIVHLEKSRGWIGGLRHVFGRVPVLQPNVFLPQWQVEGLATYEESVSTGKGRVPAGDFRMILDQAAVHGRFASLDRAEGGVIDWPSGNSPYVYGAYFHQFLAEHYGAASLARLAEATAGTLPFFGSRAFRPVFGRSLGGLWKDFKADTEARIEAGKVAPPVQPTRLTDHGFTVTAPTFSADGRLYYSLVNPHDFPAIMELRPGTTAPRRVASRYLGERMSVAGDRLVFAQLEVVRHTDLQSDLYAVPLDGGHTQRLTRDARAADPDVAPDGHTIVCTVQQAGRRILALLEIPHLGASTVPVPLLSEESTEFSTPRWSPDGRVIAAERRRLGGPSEIVLLDVATHTVRTLVASEQGRNFGPMWLADGGTVLFSSDRAGAPFAIYGADVRTGAVRTLVGTGPGAQFPAISPDGRRLVFVGYTADGVRPFLDAVRHSPVDGHSGAGFGSGCDLTGSRRPRSGRGRGRALSPVVHARAAILGSGGGVRPRRCAGRCEHQRVRRPRPPRVRRDRNVGGSTKRTQLAGRLLIFAVVARAVRGGIGQHR